MAFPCGGHFCCRTSEVILEGAARNKRCAPVATKSGPIVMGVPSLCAHSTTVHICEIDQPDMGLNSYVFS